MTTMRIDKYLADMSVGTRSEIKKLIKQKRVTCNQEIVKDSGLHVDRNVDQIYVDDVLIEYEKYAYYMLYKPAGYVSATRDASATVMDLIDEPVKDLFPCGRLDKDTTGLLLITNDGQLAHNLLSPKKHVSKTYYVETLNEIDEICIKRIREGITIDGDELCQPAEIELISDHSCHLTICEGKYHQVKRMFLACDNEVTKLKRISMKNLILDENLIPGQYRKLTKEEISGLREPIH